MAIHDLQRADLRRYTREGAGLGADLMVLFLTIASGLVGMYTQSLTVMLTVFFGAAAAYIAYNLPKYLEELKKALDKKEAGKADQHDAAPAASKSKQLPSPELAFSLIANRRSVYPRDFTGQRVPRDKVEKMLEAANWAPTHKLTEPWRFVVLEGDSKRKFEDLTIELCQNKLPAEKAAATVEKLNKKKSKDWAQVSCYIALVMRPKTLADKSNPEWEEMCSTACATQNMMLMGTAMGLGMYWTSWQEVARESEEMKEFLGLEKQDRILGLLVVGMTERADVYRGSRKPWADKVTWKA